MKIYAFNGSPRKNRNTARMIQALTDGIRQAAPDAEIEIIHLYDYTYTGCKSCFACKQKGSQGHLHCHVPDGIHDILANAFQADGLVFASPIYFMDVSAQMKAFLERLMYPGDADKIIPSAMIFTMKASEEMKRKFHIDAALASTKAFLTATFHQAPECVYSYSTNQYSDSEMSGDGFRASPPGNVVNWEQRYQVDLHQARDAGVRLVERIREAAK